MSTLQTAPTRPRRRLAGIDLARALALVGMIAVHTFELATADGAPLPASAISGKAAALFAVLAGFSITLSTRSYDRTSNAVLSLLTRGAAIAALGLILGSITTNIAVILVNYGVLFMLAPLVFRLSTKTLAILTPLWLVLSPVIGFAIRSGLDLNKAWDMPHLGNWYDLPYMITAIFSTGYFPVVEWFGYILVGLLLSRFDWHKLTTMLWACVTGVAAAVLAPLVSTILLKTTNGMQALVESTEGVHPKDWGGLTNALYVANAGTTPTDTWWWLAIAGPHSSTPFDLIHTTGIAITTIAACMLLCHLLGERTGMLKPVLVAGTMPLTLYTGHVLLREFSDQFWIHVLVLGAFASFWKVATNQPGPLEKGLSKIVQQVAPKKSVDTSTEPIPAQ